MNDSQFYRIIGAVDDIAYGGLGNAAFHIQLILRHFSFIQQFQKSNADRLIQFQFFHRPLPCTKAIIGSGMKNLVPVAVLSLLFLI